ncbi:DUF4252 domain-containing protein [uncultured Muribaculum sp.]|uniref:DUF4252 domain-containing protein n=1 Tax=uncultured Muribaculum sp. TaxID=1918613 RepID=UPI0025B75EE6|nr:DUF4252 domain-containing protein [uncultured Muribaculum sp.]
MMSKCCRFLLLLILPLSAITTAFAQNRLFSQLSLSDDVNYVYISKEMMSGVRPLGDSGELSAFFDVMSGLESIEILTIENLSLQSKALRKLPKCVDGLVCLVETASDIDNDIIKMYMVPNPDGMAGSFLMLKQTGVNVGSQTGQNSVLTAILLTGNIDAGKLKGLTRQ